MTIDLRRKGFIVLDEGGEVCARSQPISTDLAVYAVCDVSQKDLVAI